MSLLRRNLFSAVTLRYQAGEFRQKNIDVFMTLDPLDVAIIKLS